MTAEKHTKSVPRIGTCGQGCGSGCCSRSTREPFGEKGPEELAEVSAAAPYFDGAHILLLADKEAYAYASFHEQLIAGKRVLLGRPKRKDDERYIKKLAEILIQNDVESLTLVRVGGRDSDAFDRAVEEALRRCGKVMDYEVVIVNVSHS